MGTISEALSFLNVRLNTKTFSAPWLIIKGHIWYLLKGKSSRIDNDIIKGAVAINWERILPDGEKLTSPVYEKLLNLAQWSFFKLRASPLTRDMDTEHHALYATYLFAVIDWVVTRKDLYNPAEHFLALIDSSAIEDMSEQFALDGIAAVADITGRIDKFFKSIIACKTDLFIASVEIPEVLLYRNCNHFIPKTFSSTELIRIKYWLMRNHCYFPDGTINTGNLAKHINANKFFPTAKVRIFLRQFEFENDYNRHEFNHATRYREYLSVKHITIEQACLTNTAESTYKKWKYFWNNLAKLASSVDSLPKKYEITKVNFDKIAECIGVSFPAKTPTIPVEIAMLSLNHAIHYILTYGEDLVRHFLTVRKTMNKISGQKPDLGPWQVAEFAFQKTIKKMPSSLKELNITKCLSCLTDKSSKIFNKAGGNGKILKFRISPGLEDAITIFCAAVYITVAATTAVRQDGLLKMTSDCIIKNYDGYDLVFELGKANFQGERAILSRPIPDVAAKGLNILKELIDKLKKLNNETDPYLLETFFYIPTGINRCRCLDVALCNQMLDLFCDYIELPLNQQGRRWYIRTHELRRFFAITFFWQYKYSNLTSLQWMLGHVNPEHTYAYIRETIGGAELTQEEARYTAEAIIDGSVIDGIDELKKSALHYFGTADIALITKEALSDYMTYLLEEGWYKLIPRSLETEDGYKYEIVFELQKNAA
ncbi:MAG TPA: hypothetical protein PLK94_00225 [Alphaproteobacteria bacterium]|nr:hypothetical protein [Alphaproteobacteria bacterium]